MASKKKTVSSSSFLQNKAKGTTTTETTNKKNSSNTNSSKNTSSFLQNKANEAEQKKSVNRYQTEYNKNQLSIAESNAPLSTPLTANDKLRILAQGMVDTRNNAQRFQSNIINNQIMNGMRGVADAKQTAAKNAEIKNNIVKPVGTTSNTQIGNTIGQVNKLSKQASTFEPNYAQKYPYVQNGITRDVAKAQYDALSKRNDAVFKELGSMDYDPVRQKQLEDEAEALRVAMEKADQNVVNATRDQNNYMMNEEGYRKASILKPSTYIDLFANSISSGAIGSLQGENAFNGAMQGNPNRKDYLGNTLADYENVLNSDQFKYIATDPVSKGIVGMGELAGQIIYQRLNPRAAISGFAAAGAAIKMQNERKKSLGGGVGWESKLITPMVAYMTAVNAAGSVSNAEIEAGQAYIEMMENGISEKTAAPLAMVVGGINGMLEGMQADEMIKGISVLNDNPITQKYAKTIVGEISDRALSTGNEILQEVLQELTTMSGVGRASMIEKGVPAYTSGEVAQRVGETAVSSALTFGTGEVTKAASNIVSNTANRQIRYNNAVKEFYKSVREGSNLDKEKVTNIADSIDLDEKNFTKKDGTVNQELKKQAEKVKAKAEDLATKMEENKAKDKEVVEFMQDLDTLSNMQDQHTISDTYSTAKEVYSGLDETGKTALTEMLNNSQENQKDIKSAGFNTVYQQGRFNLTSGYDAAVNKAKENHLTDAEITAAYDAGLQDYKSEMQKVNQVSLKKFKAVMTNEATNLLSKEQKEFLRNTANDLKINVNIDTTMKPNEGAKYNSTTRTLSINPHARDLAGSLIHDVTHVLQETAPEEYKAYRQSVASYLRFLPSSKAGNYLDEQIAKYKSRYEGHTGRTLTETEILDEIIADGSMNMMNETKFMKKLAAENPSIVAKIIRIFDDVINAFREAFGKSRGNEVTEVLEQNAEKMIELRNQWWTAYKAAKESDTGYALNTDERLSNNERMAIDSADNDGKNVKESDNIEEKTDAKTMEQEYKRDLDKLIENLNNASNDSENKFDFIREEFDGLIRDAKDEYIDANDLRISMSSIIEDSLGDASIELRPFVIQEKKVIEDAVRMVFGETERIPMSFEVIDDTERKVVSISDRLKNQNNDNRYSIDSSSDMAYMDAVKRGDMETAQKMVDEAAKKAGYPIKAFHGTPVGGFTKYDFGKGGLSSGVGRGVISLTDNKSIAEIYAGNKEKSIKLNKEIDSRKYVDLINSVFYDDRIDTDEIENAFFYGEEIGEWDYDMLFDSIYDMYDFPTEEDYESKYDYEKAYKDAENKAYYNFIKSELERGLSETTGETKKVINEALSKIDDIKTNSIGEPTVYEWYIPKADKDYYAKNQDEYAKIAREASSDGARVSALHLQDEGTRYFVKSNKDIKSADPVTYDDNGNVIPLSERFNDKNEDIRYSLDSEQKPRSAQAQRDAGYMLNEKKFYQLYSAHKIDIGGTRGNIQEQIKNIKEKGFTTRTAISNVMPSKYVYSYAGVDNYNQYLKDEAAGLLPEGFAEKYKNGYKDRFGEEYGSIKFSNESERRYAPRKGEYILLVPESYVEKGERVKTGFKPFDYEVVQAEYDYQPYYEMYEKAYKNRGTRFSLSAPVEETDRLIALHNMNESALRGMMEIGGLAMPSIAITPANRKHSKFGDVSVVFGKQSIDPKNKNNEIYGGDAWTPTFPEIGYKINSDKAKKILQRVRKATEGIGVEYAAFYEDNISDKLNRSNGSFDSYKDNLELQITFLKENGIDVPIPMKYADTKSGLDAEYIQKALRTFKDVDRLNEEGYSAVQPLLDKFKEIKREYYLKKWDNAKGMKIADTMVKNFGYADAREIIDDMVSFKWNGGIRKETDRNKLKEVVSKKIEKNPFKKKYEEWFAKLSEGIVEKKGVRNDKTVYTNTGNRRSFEQLYFDYSLANIVKAMTSQAKQGIKGFLTGAGSIKGSLVKKYGSIEEVRNEIGRIKDFDGFLETDAVDDESKAKLEAFSNHTLDICNRLVEGKNLGLFAANDAAEVLVDTFANTKTKDGIYSYLTKNYGNFYNVNKEICDEIYGLIKEVNELPIPYFESKLYRAVPANEPIAYVVPSNIDKKLVSDMKNQGLNVIKYKAGDEEDRLNKINSIDNSRFSLDVDSYLDEKSAAYADEEAKAMLETMRDQLGIEYGDMTLPSNYKGLQDANNAITKYLKRIHKVPSTTSINKVARAMISETESARPVKEVAQKLSTLYEYIQNNKYVDGEQVSNTAKDIAEWLLGDQTKYYEDIDVARYKELKDAIKAHTILVEDEYIGDLDQYDGFKGLRKYFGTLKLSRTKGMTADSVVAAIREENPGLIPEDVEGYNLANPASALDYLIDRLETEKPVPRMRDADYDEWTYRVGQMIYDAYFDTEFKTGDETGEKLLKEYHEGIKEFRKARAEEQSRRQWEIEKQKKYKSEYEARVAAMRNRWKTYKENEKTRAAKKSIISSCNSLTRTLENPTNTKHIPEAFRVPLANFLSNIDYTTGNFKADDVNMSKMNMDWMRMQAIVAKINANEGTGTYTDENGNVVYITVDPDLDEKMLALSNTFDSVMDLNKMSREDIFKLRDVMTAIKKTIETSNQMLSDERKRQVSYYGEGTLYELNKYSDGKKYIGFIGTMKKLLFNDQLDAYTRFHTFGKRADEVLGLVQKGFENKILQIREASDYVEDLKNKTGITDKDIDNWDYDTIDCGNEKLTVSQVMALYELMKRPQAKQHILEGGVTPMGYTIRNDIKQRVYKPSGNVHFTEQEILDAIGKLTEEQRNFADGLTRFFQRCSVWGNEASMKMYGYSKFTDPNYFPIKTDATMREAKTPDVMAGGAVPMTTLKGMGAAKNLTPGANNAIVLDGILNTFVSHVDQMSSYSSLMVPLDDAQKWYNYKVYGNKQSDYRNVVSGAIKRVYGNEANSYVLDLFRSMNGTNTEADKYPFNKFISAYKGASVAFNLSVFVQQPTSYVRAIYAIDPKYLVKAMDVKDYKADYDLIKHYAPIAQWKDWGFYDVNVGRSMKQIMVGSTTTMEKLREAGTWLAGKGDEVTWGRLWVASELKVQAETKLEKGTEEYYQKVGEVFTDIINKTQVVDSTLNRSSLMRSGNDLTKMATAFMAEATKSYNMIYRAVFDYKTADAEQKAEKKKALITAVSAFVLSGIASAAAKSFITAARRGGAGREKDYWDRYLEALVDETVSNLNPINIIPYAKDVFEMIQTLIEGGQVQNPERIDATWVKDLSDTFNRFQKTMDDEKGAYTITNDILYSTKLLSDLTGIAFYGMQRDVNAMIDTMLEAIGADAIEYEKYKLLGKDIKSNASVYIGLALRYYAKGNAALGDKVVNDLKNAGWSQEDIDKKMKSAMKKNPELADAVPEGASESTKMAALETKLNVAKNGATKKADVVKAIMGLDVSEEEKGILYEMNYSPKALTVWKEIGGTAYDYMKYNVKLSAEALEKVKRRSITAEKLIEYMDKQDSISIKDVRHNPHDSDKKLYADIGSADVNEEWHHIVEQSKENNNISVQAIQNSNNVVSIPAGTQSVHKKLTTYYNSKHDFTGGKTFREWLEGKSFSEQWTYGVKALQEFGYLIPSEDCWVFIPFEALEEE